MNTAEPLYNGHAILRSHLYSGKCSWSYECGHSHIENPRYGGQKYRRLFCATNSSFALKYTSLFQTSVIHQKQHDDSTYKYTLENFVIYKDLLTYRLHFVYQMAKILHGMHLFIGDTSLQRTPFLRTIGVRYREVPPYIKLDFNCMCRNTG